MELKKLCDNLAAWHETRCRMRSHWLDMRWCIRVCVCVCVSLCLALATCVYAWNVCMCASQVCGSMGRFGVNVCVTCLVHIVCSRSSRVFAFVHKRRRYSQSEIEKVQIKNEYCFVSCHRHLTTDHEISALIFYACSGKRRFSFASVCLIQFATLYWLKNNIKRVIFLAYKISIISACVCVFVEIGAKEIMCENRFDWVEIIIAALHLEFSHFRWFVLIKSLLGSKCRRRLYLVGFHFFYWFLCCINCSSLLRIHTIPLSPWWYRIAFHPILSHSIRNVDATSHTSYQKQLRRRYVNEEMRRVKNTHTEEPMFSIAISTANAPYGVHRTYNCSAITYWSHCVRFIQSMY